MHTSFATWLRARGLSDSTITHYIFLLSRLTRIAGSVEELSLDGLCRSLETLYGRRNRENGIKLTLIAVRRYSEYLTASGVDCADPTAGWVFHSHSSRNLALAEFLTQEELQQVERRTERYGILSLRNRLILQLLLRQAMTSYEISRLLISDIDLEGGTVMIRASPRLNRRRLPLTGTQTYLLIHYYDQVRPSLVHGEDDGRLIRGKLGRPAQPGLVSYVVEQFKPALAPREVTPQRIRQSVIYHWLNSDNLPLERVQLMAGHRDIESTIRYRAPYSQEDIDRFNKAHPMNSWIFSDRPQGFEIQWSSDEKK